MFCSKLFTIKELILHINSFLPLNQICRNRKVNRRFYHLLVFEFACVDSIIVFRYNYKIMKQTVENIVGNNFQKFIQWYFHWMNMSLGCNYFLSQLLDEDDHKLCGKMESKFSENAFRQFTVCCRQRFNNWETDEAIHLRARQKFESMENACDTVNENGMETVSYTCRPLRSLYTGMSYIDNKIANNELFQDTMAYNFLLCGKMFGIKAIVSKLNEMIDDSRFHNGLLTNLCAIVASKNSYIKTFWYDREFYYKHNHDALQACFGATAVFQTPKLSNGLFAWLGESCYTGDFTIYQKHLKYLENKEKTENKLNNNTANHSNQNNNENDNNNNNNKIEYCNLALRGVLTMITIYSRLDLLYEYKQDKVWPIESAQCVLYHGIDPFECEKIIKSAAINLNEIELIRPEKRLQFLACLVFSSKFVTAMHFEKKNKAGYRLYFQFRHLAMLLCNNMDAFWEYWCIRRYVNENESTKAYEYTMHLMESLKVVIQALFVIPGIYARDNGRTICSDIYKNNKNNNSYIDLMPFDEKSFSIYCEMIRNLSDPKENGHLNKSPLDTKMEELLPMIFASEEIPKYSKLNLPEKRDRNGFLRRLWEIASGHI